MKRVLRRISLALAVALVFSVALAGCGGNGGSSEGVSSAASAKPEADGSGNDSSATPSIDTSKSVELQWYFLGSPPQDFDDVLAELNNKAKADLNCSVTATWIGWGDYATKYPLVMASGESVDLTYGALWMDFAGEASKGAYHPLEELAPVYSPESFKQMPEDAIKQLSVNGHLYGITSSYNQYQVMGYIVRGDLMKKYGIAEIKSMDDMGKFYDAVLKNDPGIDPSGFGNNGFLIQYQPQLLGLYSVTGIYNFPLCVDPTDPEGKVVNFYERPEMADFFAKMKQWSDAGYWPKDVLSGKNNTSTVISGTSAAELHNQNDWVRDYMAAPQYDLKFYPAQPHSYKSPYTQNVICVGAAAANPERSLMLLEKLMNDQSYYNLIEYGVEGKDYTLTSDGKLKPTDPNVFSPEGISFGWAIRNEKFRKILEGSPPDIEAVMKNVDAIGADNRYINFTFNTDPVKNEMAAIQSVLDQYANPLALGYIDDPAKGLATLKEKLALAGLATVQPELQKQLDEFNASYK